MKLFVFFQLIQSDVIKIRDEMTDKTRILPYAAFQCVVRFKFCVVDQRYRTFVLCVQRDFYRIKSLVHVVMDENDQFLVHNIDLENRFIYHTAERLFFPTPPTDLHGPANFKSK
jgi:hypothetical protein